MRIAVGVLRIQADPFEESDDAFIPLLSRRRKVVDIDGFPDDIPDCHARIERGIRILEYDLHLLAVRQHVDGNVPFLVKQHLPVIFDMTARRFVQSQQCPSGRRLATAGFPDQSECLAFPDVKGYIIDGLYDLFVFSEATGGEKLLQVTGGNQYVTLRHLQPPSSGSSSTAYNAHP